MLVDVTTFQEGEIHFEQFLYARIKYGKKGKSWLSLSLSLSSSSFSFYETFRVYGAFILMSRIRDNAVVTSSV